MFVGWTTCPAKAAICKDQRMSKPCYQLARSALGGSHLGDSSMLYGRSPTLQEPVPVLASVLGHIISFV